MDGWLFEKIMEINAKLDFLLQKLQQAEQQQKGGKENAKPKTTK